jgi:hypothetical protein
MDVDRPLGTLLTSSKLTRGFRVECGASASGSCKGPVLSPVEWRALYPLEPTAIFCFPMSVVCWSGQSDVQHRG